jgi:hypothetical protein
MLLSGNNIAVHSTPLLHAIIRLYLVFSSTSKEAGSWHHVRAAAPAAAADDDDDTSCPAAAAAAVVGALQVLQSASERVFVPLTVGGGIRGFSAQGRDYPALQVASEYFR